VTSFPYWLILFQAAKQRVRHKKKKKKKVKERQPAQKNTWDWYWGILEQTTSESPPPPSPPFPLPFVDDEMLFERAKDMVPSLCAVVFWKDTQCRLIVGDAT
jgi:hypothetical protein